MFGRSLLINLGTGLLLCWSNGVSVAMPVRRSVTKTLARDPIPLVPGASIHPAHVNLMDRHENSERQVAEAVKGTPNHDSLVNNLASSKQTFEDGIKSIAVLARADTTLSAPIPSSTVAIPSPSDSPSSSASATASASTISALPPTSINTDVPVVTVVTQIGTSVVVVASQGVTSTITLATLTNIPNSTLSSTASSGTSTSGSASVTSPAVSMPSATSTTP